MKFAFILISLLTLTSQVKAFDRLRECQYQCSYECIQLAQEVKRASEQIITNCEGRESDLVKVCKDKFYTDEKRLACIRGAKDADSVKECVDRFYTDEKRLECIGR